MTTRSWLRRLFAPKPRTVRQAPARRRTALEACAMRTLQTAADIRRFFRENETPIYYVSTTAFNLLGADEWIGGLNFLNAVDSFDGRYPNVFIPDGVPPGCLDSFEACNNALLSHPAVAEYVRSQGPGGKVLFLMFDEETERLAAHLGLEVCFPPAALRHHLDSKLTTTRLANEAGVASVPHMLGRVQNYTALRRAARDLGPDQVVQLPHGDSGTTTYFISSAPDFRAHADAITAAPEVKVMRRIRCRPLTIEACVTRHGTLVGPLMAELTGFPTLTPYRGGWCGNELAPECLGSDLRRRAQQATLALGRQLRRVGYRGCFGLDFLLDQDTGDLYLGELNPRITGATSLTSQAALDAGGVPLLLYHLLEWFGVDYRVEVAEFNARWLAPQGMAGWGQLIIEQTAETADVVTGAPASGLWRLAGNGTVSLIRREFQPRAVADETDALVLRTVDDGRVVSAGRSLGRVLTRGRLLTDDWQLNPRAEAWVRGFRQHFGAAAPAELAGAR
jgi:hypothetical protein